MLQRSAVIACGHIGRDRTREQRMTTVMRSAPLRRSGYGLSRSPAGVRDARPLQPNLPGSMPKMPTKYSPRQPVAVARARMTNSEAALTTHPPPNYTR